MKRSPEETIQAAAEHLIKEIKKYDITVLRYDSMTSNSVYLKLDDGLLGTVRISDHHGKPNLHYRYNMLLGLVDSMEKVIVDDKEKYYFPFRLIEAMVAKITYDRDRRKKRLGVIPYLSLMAKNRTNGKERGFWTQAKYV